ncbi:MAG: hypothetical protein QF878_16345 [SAR202 cluster bacterium]|jgi:hypothetical protein|nr:hypothetical protein [SAR202 cluster bacterium]
MSKLLKNTIGKKLSLGRFGVPVWIMGLAALLVVAAAGQAVGPVLSGTIQGSAGLVIEQAVTLDTDVASGSAIDFGDNNGTLGETNEPSDGVGTRNDDGSQFTIAAELTAGDTIHVNLYLQNGGVSDTSAILELNVPQNIDVEMTTASVSASGGSLTDNVVDEGQLARNKWLMTVGSEAGTDDDDGITLIIRPERLITPGFYTITGRLFQIEG